MPRSTIVSSLRASHSRWRGCLVIGAVLMSLFPVVSHAESPGLDALEEYKEGHSEKTAVENRFFLKENRFEISPIVGYVPNNPFARRYTIGGVLGFHFSEIVSVQAEVLYSPDFGEGDLKGLTSVLLERADQAASQGNEEVSFQQPLDKAGLAADFGVAWSPLYGKINLVGETVLNFDFYVFLGGGMISKKDYVAKYDTESTTNDIVNLEFQQNEVKLAPFVGIGQNYFINRLMAFKVDVRAAFYVDNKPQYDPLVAPPGQRLYNNVIASAGLAFFLHEAAPLQLLIAEPYGSAGSASPKPFPGPPPRELGTFNPGFRPGNSTGSTMFRSLIGSALAVASLGFGSTAFAQGESDLPDDIFGDDTAPPEASNRQEKEALLADEPAVQLPDEDDKKRIIQTFQRKTFLKIGRYEGAPHIGFVTNDPFVNRYLIGAGLTYHVTEIFGVEVSGTFSPDLGVADRKPITQQIIDENGVTPDISKIQFYFDGTFQFSPIYGKVAVGSGRIIVFDLFGIFGTGVVNTLDDLDALQKTTDPAALATQSQFHPTLNYGGGVRVIFSESFAVRLEGRGLSYIEVLEGTTLEMKNNFTLLASASFFFPGMD